MKYYPADLIAALKSYFQPRYEPNFAWVNAVSAFSWLPQLRGFWPMSVVNASGDVYSFTAALNRTLVNNNAVTFGINNLAPFASFASASNQYLSRPDEVGTSITGNLTFGGWFRFDAASIGNLQYCIGKGALVAPNFCYHIYKLATDMIRCLVSVDGTATTVVDSTVAVTSGVWYWLVGRFTPQTELALFVDDAKYTNVAAIPASIVDNALDFTIGATSTPGSYLDGDSTLDFLCAEALPDVIPWSCYQQSRAVLAK